MDKNLNIGQRVIQDLIISGHRITDQVSRELKGFGISEPQYNVLRILRGAKSEPLAVDEIRRRMVQRSSNVTRIIDKLIDKKFVERHECPTNRRKMDVTITPLGLEALKTFDLKVNAIILPMLERLNEKELTILNILINKLKGKNND